MEGGHCRPKGRAPSEPLCARPHAVASPPGRPLVHALTPSLIPNHRQDRAAAWAAPVGQGRAAPAAGAPVVGREVGCQGHRALSPPRAHRHVEGPGTLGVARQGEGPGPVIQDVPRGSLLAGSFTQTGRPLPPSGAALTERPDVGGLCWSEGPGPRLLGLWLVDLSGAAGSAKVVDGRGASWPWGLQSLSSWLAAGDHGDGAGDGLGSRGAVGAPGHGWRKARQAQVHAFWAALGGAGGAADGLGASHGGRKALSREEEMRGGEARVLHTSPPAGLQGPGHPGPPATCLAERVAEQDPEHQRPRLWV